MKRETEVFAITTLLLLLPARLRAQAESLNEHAAAALSIRIRLSRPTEGLYNRDGNWTALENLGAKINSTGAEYSPKLDRRINFRRRAPVSFDRRSALYERL